MYNYQLILVLYERLNLEAFHLKKIDETISCILEDPFNVIFKIMQLLSQKYILCQFNRDPFQLLFDISCELIEFMRTLNQWYVTCLLKGIPEKLDSGRLYSGRLDSEQLDAWTLDIWTLDAWKLGLWTPGRLDSGRPDYGRFDSARPDACTLDDLDSAWESLRIS